MDWLDIFDESGGHIIRHASRHEAHQKGLWHQTFHCWIAGMWHGQPALLCQERSQSKNRYPGLLDISAAGHLLVGEQPLSGVREVQEELGLSIDLDRMRFVQRRRESFSCPPVADNEFAMEYAYVLPAPIQPAQFQLQATEVSGLFLAGFHDLTDLFSGKCLEVLMAGWRHDARGAMAPASRVVTVSDFVKRPKAYYLDWITWFQHHRDEFNSAAPWAGE